MKLEILNDTKRVNNSKEKKKNKMRINFETICPWWALPGLV